MDSLHHCLRQRAYAANLTAFLIMLILPVLMALAAQRGLTACIYPPLALFIFANLLELFIP
jgi:hypothetical protein